LLTVISKQSRSLEHLVVIGHNPGLSDLCNHLIEESRYLPTCGCFSIKFNSSNWDLQPEIKILDLAHKYPSK